VQTSLRSSYIVSSIMYKDEGMVSVNDAGGSSGEGHPRSVNGQVDEGHEMVIHQLTNAHQNACALLKHFAECSTPHHEEEWIKKKIILATDYLDSVHDYVFSSHEEGMGKVHNDASEDGFLVMVEKSMTNPQQP